MVDFRLYSGLGLGLGKQSFVEIEMSPPARTTPQVACRVSLAQIAYRLVYFIDFCIALTTWFSMFQECF